MGELQRMDKIRRRTEIEMRLEAYRDNACSSMLEMGRWLNVAKDEGVAPHGEWTAWVQEHTYMSERTAQDWMRAARELPPGSPLERLGIAKIRTLLTLPQGEREAAAEEMHADELSTRDVERRVKALKAERDEALRVVGEQKKELNRIHDREKDAVDAAVKDAIRLEREDAEKARKEAEAAKQQEGEARAALLQSEAERTKLMAALDKADQTIGAAAQEQIRVLKKKLEENEKEIDRLTDELDEAQTAAIRGAMTGEEDRCGAPALILSAIGALMTSAGRAPGELAHTQGLDEETRELLIGQARLAGQWAMQVIAACGGEADRDE